jgi:hypothetical protein
MSQGTVATYSPPCRGACCPGLCVFGSHRVPSVSPSDTPVAGMWRVADQPYCRLCVSNSASGDVVQSVFAIRTRNAMAGSAQASPCFRLDRHSGQHRGAPYNILSELYGQQGHRNGCSHLGLSHSRIVHDPHRSAEAVLARWLLLQVASGGRRAPCPG